ncbi:MAG: hypothetical protein JKP98_02560 [Rhodobacteraceae bacterium]|nr:hypothetical protein [Paracoccaceae bacterium]
MSIWTSSAIFGAIALALAGCSSLGIAAATGPRAQTVTTGGMAVTLAAPDGFCIDRRASRPRANPPVVLFVPCGAEAPRRPAVLTATASAAVAGQSVAGSGRRCRISCARRRGAPRSAATVGAIGRRDRQRDPGRCADRASARPQPTPAPGLSPTYRRAFLNVGDALVSIAVLGVDADPMGNAQSRALLAAGIAAIRAANAAPVLAEAG